MIKNREKHLKVYLALSVLIFLIAGGAHTWRLFKNWPLFMGPVEIPTAVSALAIFVTLAMIVMGVYYLVKK